MAEKEIDVESDQDTDDENKTVSLNTMEDFQRRLMNRTTPYTYLKYNYKIKGANSIDKIVFATTIRALLGCAPFVDKLRQHMNEPIATEFRKIINVVSYDRNVVPDITNVYKKYSEAMHGANTRHPQYREYGDIIRFLIMFWKTSRLRKLFSIVRTITGYCVVCKNYGPSYVKDVGPYIVEKQQVLNPEYDLEDSLLAERVSEKYECLTCGMITVYKIIVTTSAPDIITIVPPATTTKFVPPTEITLPCEETRTHTYVLSSYIYSVRGDSKDGVCIITENGARYKTGNNSFTKDYPVIKNYNLLFYVKSGTVDNYARVIE